jgi:hypothetical protein
MGQVTSKGYYSVIIRYIVNILWYGPQLPKAYKGEMLTVISQDSKKSITVQLVGENIDWNI